MVACRRGWIGFTEIINNPRGDIEGDTGERVNGGKFTANSAEVTFCEKKKNHLNHNVNFEFIT